MATRKTTATGTPAPAKAPKAAAKTAGPARKPAAEKAAKPARAAKAAAPTVAGPAAGKTTAAAVTPEQRAHYVEVAAFYIAERRGFAPGDPVDDWLAAQAEIDLAIAKGLLGRG